MNTKLLKLEKLVNSSAWLCNIKPPKGVNAEAWGKSLDEIKNINKK
jgi:hypothetical protein